MSGRKIESCAGQEAKIIVISAVRESTRDRGGGGWRSARQLGHLSGQLGGLGKGGGGGRWVNKSCLNGYCHEIKNIFERPKSQISTCCTVCALMVFTLWRKKLNSNFLLASMKSLINSENFPATLFRLSGFHAPASKEQPGQKNSDAAVGTIFIESVSKCFQRSKKKFYIYFTR
jgi:hypothetical protein